MTQDELHPDAERYLAMLDLKLPRLCGQNPEIPLSCARPASDLARSADPTGRWVMVDGRQRFELRVGDCHVYEGPGGSLMVAAPMVDGAELTKSDLVAIVERMTLSWLLDDTEAG